MALKDHTTLCTDFSGFINKVTCDSSSKECMNGKCSKCKKMRLTTLLNSSSIAHYQQWRSVEYRAEKLDITGTVEECFLELKTQVQPFLLHTYVKREQSASFKSLVKECDGNSVVLQVDFSENATIASQREIQSAHWNHGQATYAWISHDESDTFSMVIISDDLNHTKHNVYVFMQCILTHLKASYSTSQFKQRFLFQIYTDGKYE